MGRRGPLVNAIEYWAARTLLFGLSSLPLPAAAWTGRRLGDLIRLADRRHAARAREQAADRLGLSGRELDAFVKRNFQSYGMTLAEFAHLNRMGPDDFVRLVDMDAFREASLRLLAEGKGLLFITAHFGNWEWANSLPPTFGASGCSIARPLDNPRVNELARAIRERNGFRILDKQGAIRKALREIRAGNTAGILIDQDAGPDGMMSPFLGKPASTLTIPVELAVRSGCPMLIAVCRRTPPGEGGKRFRMEVDAGPYRADATADPKKETRRLVDALNAGLSEIILRTPDQWFWIHRRWKSKPRENPREKAAN